MFDTSNFGDVPKVPVRTGDVLGPAWALVEFVSNFRICRKSLNYFRHV